MMNERAASVSNAGQGAHDGAILLADFSREGFDLVASVHREEGHVHAESGITIDDAAAVLREYRFGVRRRLTKYLHDIAVFARQAAAASESVLRETRPLEHPHRPRRLHTRSARRPPH